jgi:hypothetical protein
MENARSGSNVQAVFSKYSSVSELEDEGFGGESSLGLQLNPDMDNLIYVTKHNRDLADFIDQEGFVYLTLRKLDFGQMMERVSIKFQVAEAFPMQLKLQHGQKTSRMKTNVLAKG